MLVLTGIIIGVTIVPLILCGYLMKYLSYHPDNRVRFLAGIGGGIFSVGIITFFASSLLASVSQRIVAVFALLLIFLVLVWWMTARGSVYVRVFLRKLIAYHLVLIAIFGGVMFFFFSDLSPWASVSIFASLSVLLFSAFLEEGVKHITGAGLSSQVFRFTRIDFLLFTICVTLGFILTENIIFLLKNMSLAPGELVVLGIERLFFTLPVHIFASSLCVLWWWKALAYRPFSWQYGGTFLLGFTFATLSHFLYNFLVTGEQFSVLVLSVFGIYFCMTQWIARDVILPQ